MNLFKQIWEKVGIPAVVIVVLLVVGIAAYIYAKPFQNSSNQKASISSQDAASKLLDFVNKNVLQGQGTAALEGTTDVNGVYKVKFKVNDQEVEWAITKDGGLVFPQIVDMGQIGSMAQETGKTVGNFSISDENVCQENGKPIVYFFGSATCPHCQWEKPILEEIMAKFKDQIVFKEQIDSDVDKDIFQKYSTGGIPTVVFGCKYYRVGSGEGAGKDQEVKDLTALACKLTNGQPGTVCDAVKSETDTIK